MFNVPPVVLATVDVLVLVHAARTRAMPWSCTFPPVNRAAVDQRKASREDIAGTELDKLLTRPDRKDSLIKALPAIVPYALHDEASPEKIAAINFEAVSDFAMQDGRPGSEELRKDVHERLHELSVAVRFSMAILAQSKPELIA
jgi:hypothetical protein